MKVQINGKEEEIFEGVSVLSLLELKGINPHAVACELNLRVLKRADLGLIYLKEADTLEILRMIGGG
jgi:sulfur carrier protein